MNATDAVHDYTAIGPLASRLQQSVRAIESASQVLGLVPSLRLNNVPHFDGNQVQRLTAYFRDGQADRKAARLIADEQGADQV